MIRVLVIAGTRPNFVKAAPLLSAMHSCGDVLALLAHTGQHNDPQMSEDLLSDLCIPPPNFRLRANAKSRTARIDEIRTGLSRIIRSATPDVVLVVGDVDSTVAGALAARDAGLPLAHVEAGLRSFDRGMPEEINRILTDSLSSLFFASEPSAVENLLAEGYPGDRIFLTGNVMIDTLREFLWRARRSTVLARLGLLDDRERTRKYILATLHRAGTVDDALVLRMVWRALEEIAAMVPVVFPAHPRARSRLQAAGLLGARGNREDAGIRVIQPQPYTDFLRLESDAALVMTDSGGVQEETTALNVPCLTLRNNTERPITIVQGSNRLIGLDPVRIIEAARRTLSQPRATRESPPLWDGHCAERIVRVLRDKFGSLQKQLTHPVPSPAISPSVSSLAPASATFSA